MRDKVKEILLESIQVKEKLLRNHIGTILKIAKEASACLKRGGKIIIFGNGGSASDSQHIAAELIGRFTRERKSLAAVALTTNTSIITALANDYSYDIIFARQIEGLAQKADLAIGISTSGNAKNVILGIKQARKMGLKTVALTGNNGGSLAKCADLSLIVPSQVTARIQEAHITIAHIICELIEENAS
jgi:D-sedoheptulose 7-phosphate isomerase